MSTIAGYARTGLRRLSLLKRGMMFDALIVSVIAGDVYRHVTLPSGLSGRGIWMAEGTG